MFSIQNILFSFSCFWDTFNRTLLQMKQEDPRGVSPMVKTFSTTVYDRMLRGRQQWNQAEYMYLAGVGVGVGGWGGGGGQERLWCLAIFRFLFFTGQQQLKPDKLVHKHTPEHMNASNHAHTDFTLTWNSVVLRMWRPSGLHREESSPIEPSSILQCQSGCCRDHTCKEKKKPERRLDFRQKT